MRYTECKLQKISEELYKDIDKETVNYEINDLQNEEPVYLPSLLPNLLLNGATGIAVAMATNIPPHNLNEIVDSINLLIEKAETIGEAPAEDAKQKIAQIDFSSSATVEDLVKVIKGPDFPTGCTIYDQEEIIRMYATGKGRVVARASMDLEDIGGGKTQLVVTEIPFMVNKSTLITKIADLIKKDKIQDITELRDESNKDGIRIVIELKRGAIVKKVKNRLYKYSPLQSTFNGNFVALLDNEPFLFPLKRILEEFIKHRQQIIIRRTIYLLKKAKEREHILQGLKIALDNLDAVIQLIKKSKDSQTAKEGLVKKFELSEIQAQAILDMQLRRLSALERQKIEDELEEILATIDDHQDLLASPKRIITLLQKELNKLKEDYGDERKTKVIKGKVGHLAEEDLIVNEPCIITISEGGYIKRLSDTTYRKQSRGGKGVMGQELKEEDAVSKIRVCNTHDWVFFFSNKGKVYKLRAWEIPESTRRSKGTPLVNFLSMPMEEKIEEFFTQNPEELESSRGFVFFTSEKGRVKKTPIGEFANIRSSGIKAINLSQKDNLVFVGLSSGNDDVLITTKKGQSIRFSEDDVRPMGRTASGVIGIRLAKENDAVVGAIIIPEKKEKDISLLVVSEYGYGKKTEVGEYKIQNRAGSGIRTYKVSSKTKTGDLIAARTLNSQYANDIIIATLKGKFIRLDAGQIPSLGRDTLGVKLINLASGDKVTSVATLEDEK